MHLKYIIKFNKLHYNRHQCFVAIDLKKSFFCLCDKKYQTYLKNYQMVFIVKL